MRRFRWLAIATIGFLSAVSQANAFELFRGLDKADLTAHLSVFEDQSGQLTFPEVSSDAYTSAFKPWDVSRGSLNVGFTNSAIWVRVVIARQPDAPERWVLELPYAYNKFIDFYAPSVPTVYTGSGRPVSSRPLFDRFFVFPITAKTEPQAFYFRVVSNYAISVPLQVWEPKAFTKNTFQSNLGNALYYGGLLALAVYNLFLFFSLRDKRFLYYALFALSINAGIFSGNGLTPLFIWSEWSAFHEVASQFFISLAGFFGVRFSRLFLQLPEHSLRVNTAMQACEWSYATIAVLLVAAAAWGVSPQPLFLAILALAASTAILIVAAIFQALRYRVSGIRFFVIAWSILLAGTLIAALRQLGWLPTNMLTSYALQISSGIEMLLLALALAEIVQGERKARLQAQAEALLVNEKMIEALRAAEQRLEGAVVERTQQLQESVLRERHLLGQYLRFGAMISHEFRNPLGIIDSQATIIQKAKDLNDDLRQRVSIIRKTVRRLAELFELWLQGDRIRIAIDKLDIQEINFEPWAKNLLNKIPHCAETHPIEIQVGAGADRLRADSSLLEVAGINLLENACKYAPPGSPVVLQSVRSDDLLGIAVLDSGPGIPPEHLTRLGEDYYRADPSGPKGIGLGLSIVKEIAEIMGGKLEVRSEVGKGSCFTLLLPNKG